jgi:hypothetical protein
MGRNDPLAQPQDGSTNRSPQTQLSVANEDSNMKILLFAGLLLVVLGIASLVVPIPHNETEGIKVGKTNIGVQTSHSERVSPIISIVLIAGGIALSIAGASSKN